ncbi:iron chelate uptake ABC transporter family permease subunit [Trichococcus ilyis]|uniref:Abc transporter permease protein n=1 Tax=Trichococcus ilyis TaxID=640938 RepID=A0A143YY87_9LACT|nr:iron chelate uptake ABC transporter family permease subunit [Trichococcus ilyis]CZR01642.1 abc transporter permease protein [Trichococcus ilyis]SEJ25749.1 iron complex transport system permease protein [Trichococcus ilyis]
MKNASKNRIVMKRLAILAVAVACLFFFWDLGNASRFIIGWRSTKLLTFSVISISTAFATVSFQTVVLSNFLTPSLLGVESFYRLLQTMLMYFSFSFLGSQLSAERQFLFLVFLMLGSYFLLYRLSWQRYNYDMQIILMIGLVMGTFFNSISSFMQVLMDPNEYDKLQTKLFASFQNINGSVLVLAAPIALFSVISLWRKRKVLEVLGLGTQTAKNLGVAVEKETKLAFMHAILLMTVSAALVGPMMFLGFVAANIAYRLFRTYCLNYLLPGASLLSFVMIVAGQFIAEEVFKLQTNVSILVELFGGIYFFWLLWKERGKL